MDKAPKKRASRLWYLLVLIPLVGTLFPSFYASVTPEVWGIPFFYWYQMLWVILSAVTTWTMYTVLKDA